MARHVLGATALAMLLGGAALAQERRTYEIGAQPLRSALSQLAQQAGLNVAVPASQTAGLTSAAVTGAQSPEQALAALLRGTGLSLVIVDGTVVAAAPAAQSGAVEDGTVLLSPVALSAGGAYWDGNPAAVYDTTANVEAIHSGTLETYQIATPSDILRSATGVMSGDSRNSGSLNVNIHGLQGQGRVPVTVDGAENNTTVYRGYQGVADRSFIDPDFIGSVGIEKGASTARAGIGGAVSITTLTVDDILREGQSSGFRLKVSAAGNTSRSPFGTTPGNSASRPGLLSPTSGSTSLSYAHRGEWVDLVAGLSYRRSGNYHAGSHGDTVGEYYNQYNQLVYGDLSPVGHDGEALNTSNETLSGLLKATFNFSDDLKWRLGYSRYDTKFGEVMPSRYFLYGLTEAKPTETTLDSLTSRLRWNPAGSDLVDLTWNVWLTRLETENAAISTTETVLTKSKVLTFGTDLTNKAHFSTSWGEVSWTSGIAYKHEDAKVATAEPGSATGLMNREGARHEASVFSNAEWTPNSWLSFNAGLRYSYADISPRSTAFATDSHASSFDKSFGVAVKPNDDITLYANYRFASRLPSLYESVLQTVIAGNSSIQPERVHNLDIGVNMTRDNIIGDDSLRFKFSYFDSKIDNYVIRNMGNNGTALGIFFLNIDKARFQGFDLSSEYERLGFSARLSATYYTGVEFCNSTGCAENSYAGDYSKNHMPPKFQLALDMSQTFMDDRLTLGGRVTRTGSRVNSPAQMLAGNSLIAPIVWKPHTVVDLYAHYKINEDLRVSFDIHNLADAYYVQPLSLASTPGPGRTARISLDYRF